MKTIITIVLFCLVGLPSALAQSGKGFSIEPSFYLGKIVKHKSDLTIGPLGNSYGVHLHFKFQTFGRKAWHRPNRFPEMSVDLLYYSLGNKDQLGNAVGLLPNINIRLLDRKKTDIILSFGSGIAVLSKQFDPIDNPKNNAIGSHLNNVTAFRVGVDHLLQPRWSLNGGLSFTHFSNGSIQLPNFGLNIPSVYLGVTYRPNPLTEADYDQWEHPKPEFKRFGVNVRLDLAFREILTFGGPRYPIYIAAISGMYHLNDHNRLLLGLEYEFNRGVYNFGLDTYTFNNGKEARKGASRVMLHVADEVLFGNIGILFQSGIYISKSSFLLPGSWYNKLGTRYYFPAIGKPKTRFYVGFYIKAHKIVAEYFAIGMGAAF